MNEIFYVLFLLSGVIKPFLAYYEIPTGIDFTLLIAITMLFLIMRNLKKNNLIFHLDRTSLYSIFLMIGLLSLILFSFFYTSSQQYVYTKALQFLTVLFSFLFPLLIQNFSVRIFFKYFIIITSILSIIFLPLFMKGYATYLTEYAAFQGSTLKAVYQSYLPMGYIIALALIINIFSKTFVKNYKIIISLYLLLVLVVTGARGPLFAFAFIVLVFLFYRLKRIKKLKFSTIASLIMIMTILGSYIFTKFDIENLVERTYNRIVKIEKDESANSRLEFAKFVIDKIDTEHLLLGYGFGSYGVEKTGVDERNYPHNILLELLFELGIIGLLIYLLLLILLTIRLYHKKIFISWAIFLFLFLNSLKSLSLSDSRILFGFFSILLIYEFHKNNKERLEKTND